MPSFKFTQEVRETSTRRSEVTASFSTSAGAAGPEVRRSAVHTVEVTVEVATSEAPAGAQASIHIERKEG